MKTNSIFFVSIVFMLAFTKKNQKTVKNRYKVVGIIASNKKKSLAAIRDTKKNFTHILKEGDFFKENNKISYVLTKVETKQVIIKKPICNFKRNKLNFN